MKNVQVIDDAVNCTYDVFAVDDEGFELLFPDGADVEFEDDLVARLGDQRAGAVLNALWSARVDKKTVHGIHGTLFFGAQCEDKRPFYPTKRESEMVANP